VIEAFLLAADLLVPVPGELHVQVFRGMSECLDPQSVTLGCCQLRERLAGD
jgi:hypothetical protein